MSARILRLTLPTIIVVAVAVVTTVVPARTTASEAEARLESAERLVDELAWEIDDLVAIEPAVPALVDELDRHRQAIPDDPDLAGVLVELETVADESGVELLDIVPTSILGSFDDAATPSGTSSIVVAVALRGTFSATIEMLRLLMAQPRLVVVESLAVGVDELSDALAIDLELRVFTTEELVEFEDEFLDDFEGDAEATG
jgi:hypothetical protein